MLWEGYVDSLQVLLYFFVVHVVAGRAPRAVHCLLKCIYNENLISI